MLARFQSTVLLSGRGDTIFLPIRKTILLIIELPSFVATLNLVCAVLCDSHYFWILKFTLGCPLERKSMYEEARANLLAFADELVEQGEDGQDEICRDAAHRLPVEIRIPFPDQSVFRERRSFLNSDGNVPQFAYNTPPRTPMDGGGGIR